MNKGIKLTILMLGALTMMSNVAIVTTLPYIKKYFNNVENIDFLSKLILTAPSLAIAFLAPFLGHIIHRIGSKKSTVIGLIMFSIFGSAGLYLNSIYSILISRVLLGIAIAVLMITATTFIGEYFIGEERHKFMGLQSIFIALGGVFFTVTGGILSDIKWRYSFGVYFIGLFVLYLIVKYIHKKDMLDFKEIKEIGNNINVNLIHVYFLAFLLMLVFYIIPTQIPFLLMHKFKANGSFTSMIIANAFFFNMLGAFSFAKLKKRFHFFKLYLLGFLVMAIGFIGIGMIKSIYFFFITSSLTGFGAGILIPTIRSWLLHNAHYTKQVKASGYLTSSLYLGQFASPIVFHPFIDIFGIQRFFFIIGMIINVIIFFFLYLEKN